MDSQRKHEVLIKTIPYIPVQVNPDRMQVSDGVLDKLSCKHLPKNSRYTKGQTLFAKKTPSIICVDNEYFLIHPSDNKPVEKGAYCRFKIAKGRRNWWGLKLQSFDRDVSKPSATKTSQDHLYALAKQEYATLKELGLTTDNEIALHYSASKKKWQLPIMMKYAKGVTLEKALKDFNLHPLVRLQIAINLFAAVHKLHKIHRYIHADLKPENIMVDLATCEVTLVDFGLAKKMDDSNKCIAKICGTLRYMFPAWRKSYAENVISKKMEGCLEGHPTMIYTTHVDNHALAIILAGIFGLFGDADLIKRVNGKLVITPDACVKTGIISDTSHALFKTNETIDSQQLEKLLRLANDMANDNNHIPLHSSLLHLNEIKAEYMATHEDKLRVGIFDIAAYSKGDESIKGKMISEIRKVDSIVLFDTQTRSEGMYAKFHKWLREKDFIVADKIYICTDKRLGEKAIIKDIQASLLPSSYCDTSDSYSPPVVKLK